MNAAPTAGPAGPAGLTAQPLLLFTRGPHTFAAQVAGVIEIRRFDHLRPIAGSIASLAGFVALRDRVLPVFEPVAFLNQPARPIAFPLTLCVCGTNNQPAFGLIVDRVEGQVRPRTHEQTPPPDHASEFIAGQRTLSPGQTSLQLDLSRIQQLLSETAVHPSPSLAA